MVILSISFMLSCGGPSILALEPDPQPAACQPRTFECPDALSFADYLDHGEPWRECWCQPGTWGDFIFPLTLDREFVREEWEKYRRAGCNPNRLEKIKAQSGGLWSADGNGPYRAARAGRFQVDGGL